MTLSEIRGSILGHSNPRREPMQRPEEVEAMLQLREFGWGIKRISREFGVSHHTVKR